MRILRANVEDGTSGTNGKHYREYESACDPILPGEDAPKLKTQRERIELAWAAGFFEGNGSFYLSTQGAHYARIGKRQGTPAHSIDRFRKLFPCLYKNRSHTNSFAERFVEKDSKRPAVFTDRVSIGYEWIAVGFNAVKTMLDLMPYFTRSVQERFTYLIDARKPYDSVRVRNQEMRRKISRGMRMSEFVRTYRDLEGKKHRTVR